LYRYCDATLETPRAMVRGTPGAGTPPAPTTTWKKRDDGLQGTTQGAARM